MGIELAGEGFYRLRGDWSSRSLKGQTLMKVLKIQARHRRSVYGRLLRLGDEDAKPPFGASIASGIAALALFAAAGCAHQQSLAPTGVGRVEVNNKVARALEKRVDALDAKAAQVIEATDRALWAYWTVGGTLDVGAIQDKYPELFSQSAVMTLRQAEAVEVFPLRARNLMSWFAGIVIARGAWDAEQALHALAASATFNDRDRELAWRDLPHLLAAEPSALRRQSLWVASAPLGTRLLALLVERNRVADATARNLGVASEWELGMRARELGGLAAHARALLQATNAAWREAVQKQAAIAVRLPPASLTRADLPRLLDHSEAIDAAFPEGKAASAVAALLNVGSPWSAVPIVVDSATDAHRQPLPLTAVLAPGDVRVSYKPGTGLRDAQRLMSEVGYAIALRSATTGHVSTDRLGDPARSASVAALFEGLFTDPDWVAENGLPSGVSEAATVDVLYAIRRACFALLMGTGGASPPPASDKQIASLAAEVFQISFSPADADRLRVEFRDPLRFASYLKAMEAAAQLRATLPPKWWANPATVVSLRQAWSIGSEAQVPPLSNLGVAALLKWLKVEAAQAHLGTRAVESIVSR